VIPWTVNEPADLCRMIAWGVNGLITDYPDRAMRLVKNNSCEDAN
jgi:glycerophosphoryl diester phosphodiesterase